MKKKKPIKLHIVESYENGVLIKQRINGVEMPIQNDYVKALIKALSINTDISLNQ